MLNKNHNNKDKKTDKRTILNTEFHNKKVNTKYVNNCWNNLNKYYNMKFWDRVTTRVATTFLIILIIMVFYDPDKLWFFIVSIMSLWAAYRYRFTSKKKRNKNLKIKFVLYSIIWIYLYFL